MKWTDRGHEFDAFWDEIKNIKSVFLFGAGINGQAVLECLKGKMSVKGFIDNAEEKRGRIIKGLDVKAIDDIIPGEDEAVIVTVSPEKVQGILTQLKKKNVRAYDMHFFLPVYYAYQFEKVLFTSVSYLPTTVCNLNCRCCLNFSPYLKRQEFRKLDKLESDIDLFFRKVDKVMLFHISGGEPFLYPDLIPFLTYIHEKYGEKIIRFETTTNGTVLPSEKLCHTLKECSVTVILDDYREEIMRAREILPKIEELFCKYEVNYRIQKVDKWIDLNPKKENKLGSDKFLNYKFEKCHVPWQEYRDGKLYLCNYADYASVAGLYSTRKDEYYSFWGDDFDIEEKRALMEFRLGYSRKGYVEFCGQCDGFFENPNVVKPAEQMPY